MGALIPFAFDGHGVRAVDQDGAPWFVAADVCEALGLTNPTMAMKGLDAEEKAKLNLGLAGSDATIISESGLYTIILRCRDAMTPGTPPYRFRKWVTSEVLPAIRRTGSFAAPDPMKALNDPATMRSLLLGYSEKVLALESENAELTPKAEALDRISSADGLLCITDTAKALQMRPKDLFSWLNRHEWIYRRIGGQHWLGYQSKVQAGYLEHKVTVLNSGEHNEKVVERVMVTGRGLAKLAKAVKPPTPIEAAQAASFTLAT